MSKYGQPMSQTLAQMQMNELKMNDPKLLKVFNKLKPKATVKIKHSSTLERGKDFIEYIVKSKNTLRNGVEKITLARKDSPTSVKRFLYNRDGKVTFAVGDMAASIDDIKEKYSIINHEIIEAIEVEEGYESEVLKVLDDAGIDGYFRNGKLYVSKRDANAAKSALEDADNIMKLPKMVKEEVEDLDEMDMKYVLINMQGKVQGYASDKKDALDIARRTKSTMHPIKKKISDKTLEKMNALTKTPKELQDLGIIEAIDPADLDLDATDADKKAADKNIIMQMRKAMDVRGNMPIEFANGKKEKVDPKILDMMTKAHMKIQKPRDKEKFVAMISKSKRDMLNVAKKLSTLRAELDKDDVDTVMDVIKGLEKAVKTHQGQVATLKKDIKDDLDKEDEPIVKKVVKMLKKASGAHAGQAKDLEKAMTEEVELDEKNKLKPGAKFDFRLFDDEDSPGSDKANADMNKEIHKAVRMKDKETARKHMMKVQNKYSKHGATDTEPREVINQVLDAIFEMKEKFMSRRPSSKDVKMAIGIANDPRYKGGNMTGAVKAIEKIRDGLSKYPEVADALKKANENLEEGAMKKVVTDVEDAMGPTKIRYKLKQKGGKFIVSVDSNDEEDAQKALKMHPLYVSGKLRVVPEELTNEENDMTKSLKDTVLEMWTEASEGFASDAQRRAAFASGYKEKGKKKKEEGNAFGAALQAAKEKGEDTFVVAGKTYKVKDEEKKLDKVNPKAVKKDFDDRQDKDIDNDGDVDSTDKYLHKRRKAISKAIKSEEFSTPEIERYLETKRNSLRDAVLQVWGEKHTPGHEEEEEKNEKKSLTKEKKNGIKKMTDTGKEVTPVETSVKMPKIKETKNKV